MPTISGRSLRFGVAAAALTLGVACTGQDIPVVCTAAAPFTGVTVQVAAPLSHRAETLAVRVCQDAFCDDVDARLMPNQVMARAECAAATCSPADIRTASGRRALVDVPYFGGEPAQVSLVFRDESGTTLAAPTVDVVPVDTMPPGSRCGVAFEAWVDVLGDGSAVVGARP